MDDISGIAWLYTSLERKLKRQRLKPSSSVTEAFTRLCICIRVFNQEYFV